MAKNGSRQRDKITARLGKATVDAAAASSTGRRKMVWDTEVKGFGVRIAANGTRTYVLRYRMAGRASPQRMLTIGRHQSPISCGSAWERDPVSGVIGVGKGPLIPVV